MSRSSEVSLGEAPLTSEASPSGYEKPNVITCVECASRGAEACVEVEPRHKTPVFSSVKRVFRLPKGGTFFAKPLPPSKTDCRGRSLSILRMAPLLQGKSRDQGLKQRFQCRLLLRCPEARRFLTPRLCRHALRCQRITSLCGPPRRTSVQTARTAQDSARSILGSPLAHPADLLTEDR